MKWEFNRLKVVGGQNWFKKALKFLPALVLCYSFGATAEQGKWSERPSWSESKTGSSGRSVSSSGNSGSSRYQPRSPLSPGSNNVSLHLGQIFLTGDLASQYENSIGTQIHYSHGVSDMFTFNTSLGFSGHGGSLKASQDYSMLSLLPGIRMNLSWYDQLVPYVKGGMGFYKPTHQLSEKESASALLFGIHTGVGADLVISDRFFFGGTMGFYNMFGKRKQTSSGFRELGGTYISFLFHGGMSF